MSEVLVSVERKSGQTVTEVIRLARRRAHAGDLLGALVDLDEARLAARSNRVWWRLDIARMQLVDEAVDETVRRSWVRESRVKA